MAKTSIPARKLAYEHLRALIVRVELPPGATVSENEIAGELGMSRTPVREALMLLREEGLVQTLPQVGTFVTRIDPSHVAEAQFLREAVELASLRSLAYPLDEGLLGELRQNLDEQDTAGANHDRFFELDEQFHRGLMVLAGHEASWATVAAAKGHLDRARHLGMGNPDSWRERAAEHRAVFEAVVASDLEGAAEALRQHLRIVFKDIQSISRDSPQLFAEDPDARPVRRSVIVWE